MLEEGIPPGLGGGLGGVRGGEEASSLGAEWGRVALPGWSQSLVCGNVFDLPERYVCEQPLGRGAYGVVCVVHDRVTGESLAVKKVSNAFDNVVDARRILREIQVLKNIAHENIISLKDVLMPPDSSGCFRDVYLVHDLMETDLHQVIRSPQPLSIDHIQFFVYQMLRGIKFLHAAKILHRDLKPSNLVLNENCDLKITDFGLVRPLRVDAAEDPENSASLSMTRYVVTRWYRAPEVLLSSSSYEGAIDVWSVGCIMAELFGRIPIFQGRDYMHQLAIIVEALGTPSDEDTRFVENEAAVRYIRGLPHSNGVNFAKKYPDATPDAVDLLGRMLMFNPNKRITVEQALEHPFLATLHDLNEEPVCAPFDHLVTDNYNTLEMLVDEIYNEERAFAFARGRP